MNNQETINVLLENQRLLNEDAQKRREQATKCVCGTDLVIDSMSSVYGPYCPNLECKHLYTPDLGYGPFKRLSIPLVRRIYPQLLTTR